MPAPGPISRTVSVGFIPDASMRASMTSGSMSCCSSRVASAVNPKRSSSPRVWSLSTYAHRLEEVSRLALNALHELGGGLYVLVHPLDEEAYAPLRAGDSTSGDEGRLDAAEDLETPRSR